MLRSVDICTNRCWLTSFGELAPRPPLNQPRHADSPGDGGGAVPSIVCEVRAAAEGSAEGSAATTSTRSCAPLTILSTWSRVSPTMWLFMSLGTFHRALASCSLTSSTFHTPTETRRSIANVTTRAMIENCAGK